MEDGPAQVVGHFFGGLFNMMLTKSFHVCSRNAKLTQRVGEVASGVGSKNVWTVVFNQVNLLYKLAFKLINFGKF